MLYLLQVSILSLVHLISCCFGEHCLEKEPVLHLQAGKCMPGVWIALVWKSRGVCCSPDREDVQSLSTLAVYESVKKSNPFDMTVKWKSSVITSGEL